jgi:hypothetical protein
MKKTLFATALMLIIAVVAHSQSGLPAIDKSPLDVCYYPVNYPLLKMQGKATEPLCARVFYSRPKKEGRSVFGGLVGYGKVWRLGANEATEIELYKPATIGGKKVAAGRYTLYALVNEKTWTFIFNKDNDIWGAFKYDSTKDVARAEVPVEQVTDPVEYLSMTFNKTNDGVTLVVAWESTKASLPITF